MKHFLVMYSQKQPDIFNDDLLNKHVDFLKQLYLNNHLSVCGPFVDNKGAVLVIIASSIVETDEIINQDPFISQKYYEKYIIHEFTSANAENNWLIDSKQTKDNLEN